MTANEGEYGGVTTKFNSPRTEHGKADNTVGRCQSYLFESKAGFDRTVRPDGSCRSGDGDFGVSISCLETVDSDIFVVIALMDALFLERYQSHLKKLGAKIQETFDCDVLNLPWRRLKAGDAVDTELVREEGKAYLQKQADKSYLENWYPPVVSLLPCRWRD